MSQNNDFYKYVNNKWLSETTIPQDESRWGTFNILNKENEHKLLQIIESDNDNRLSLLYNQFLNRPKTMNITLIQNIFDKINSIDNKESLCKTIWEIFTSNDIGCILNLFIYSDYTNSNFNILHLGGGGIGLPDRDYYFKSEHESTRIKYKEFLNTFCSLFKIENTDCIYNLEKQLAESMYDKIKRRDPHMLNNPYTIDVLDTCFPCIRLKQMFQYLNIETKKINVSNPGFLKKYNSLLSTISIKTWKNYLKYLYARKFGRFIGQDIEQLLFNFYSTTLNGVDTMKSENIRAMRFIEGHLGMILSQQFVKKYFTEDNKHDVINMISNIKTSIANKLNHNWMEHETKLKALDKLNKMTFKIGYPDKWRDYSNLNINDQNNIIDNIINISRFEYNFDLSQLYKPYDKTLWLMLPHEVNAYYSPSQNEIVFPAGILQKPFYKYGDIDANYGGIGCIIGHEITHGFDDEGCKFDGDGNLQNWWSDIDKHKYSEMTLQLCEQYNKLTIEDLKVDGKLTLGENIADLGGVSISWDALHTHYEKLRTNCNPKLFFYNYARIWKSLYRYEALKLRINTDPHSPPCFRVNQVLKNFQPFYNTFNIKENDKMYLKNKVTIW
jgi:predicted metalloendopeptidase